MTEQDVARLVKAAARAVDEADWMGPAIRELLLALVPFAHIVSGDDSPGNTGTESGGAVHGTSGASGESSPETTQAQPAPGVTAPDILSIPSAGPESAEVGAPSLDEDAYQGWVAAMDVRRWKQRVSELVGRGAASWSVHPIELCGTCGRHIGEHNGAYGCQFVLRRELL